MNARLIKTDPVEWISHSLAGRNPLDGFFDLPDIGLDKKGSFPVDIKEYDNDYKIYADIPGYSKDDIGIDLENNLLTISAGKSSESTTEEKGRFVRRERSVSGFSRSFRLSKDIDESGVEAKLDSGVLELILPKSTASAKKRIEVS